MSSGSIAAAAVAPGAAGRPDLTVVVMAFDEVANLQSVVNEIRDSVERAGVVAEILIVDDGSRDGTAELADRLAAQTAGARVVHHPANQGLGAVYRTGFAEARGELLTFFPADGQFPASILEAFLPAIRERDLVIGYVPRRDAVVGRLLSMAERALYRVLLGALPRFQGVFMVRTARLRQLPLATEGRAWVIVMEMLVRAVRLGWRIESRPTPLRSRLSGRSKVQNARTVWANLRGVIALRGRL